MHHVTLITEISENGNRTTVLGQTTSSCPGQSTECPVALLLGQLLEKVPWRRRFEKLHGNLLSLLEVETQPAALEALAQYYDSQVRYFTFKDFQIAPTLEEYEESPLYFHQGQPPSWATIARLLRVSEAEMSKWKRNRNGIEGIPRVYIEERLLQFQEEQDWDAMIDVLGLLLYGVVFLAKRDRGENPTMAVLANTYYTLSYCSGRKTRSLRYCTPLF
ncbi:hypothetical protein CR513_26875, partial [Mucuna pruriens]